MKLENNQVHAAGLFAVLAVLPAASAAPMAQGRGLGPFGSMEDGLRGSQDLYDSAVDGGDFAVEPTSLKEKGDQLFGAMWETFSAWRTGPDPYEVPEEDISTSSDPTDDEANANSTDTSWAIANSTINSTGTATPTATSTDPPTATIADAQTKRTLEHIEHLVRSLVSDNDRAYAKRGLEPDFGLHVRMGQLHEAIKTLPRDVQPIVSMTRRDLMMLEARFGMPGPLPDFDLSDISSIDAFKSWLREIDPMEVVSWIASAKIATDLTSMLLNAISDNTALGDMITQLGNCTTNAEKEAKAMMETEGQNTAAIDGSTTASTADASTADASTADASTADTSTADASTAEESIADASIADASLAEDSTADDLTDASAVDASDGLSSADSAASADDELIDLDSATADDSNYLADTEDSMSSDDPTVEGLSTDDSETDPDATGAEDEIVQVNVRGFFDAIGDIGNKIKEGVEDKIIDPVKSEVVEPAKDALATALPSIVVSDVVPAITSTAVEVVDKVEDTAKKVIAEVKDTTLDLIDKAKDITEDVKEMAKEGIDQAIDTVKKLPSFAVNETIQKLLGEALQKIIAQATEVATTRGGGMSRMTTFMPSTWFLAIFVGVCKSDVGKGLLKKLQCTADLEDNEILSNMVEGLRDGLGANNDNATTPARRTLRYTAGLNRLD